MRNPSLELLRIFAMFLIVCHHFAVHGAIHAGRLSELLQFSFIKVLWVQFLASGGKIGVNLFVLITGYFLIKSTPKISSLVRLYLTTVFYTIPIYFLFVFLHKTHFSLETFLENLFPITTGRYWFITCYAVLFLFAPFLGLGLRCIFGVSSSTSNKLNINNFSSSKINVEINKNKKIFNPLIFFIDLLKCKWIFSYPENFILNKGFIRGLFLNITLFILFSFVPTFILKGKWPSFYVNDLIWFITLFCQASFISFFGLRLPQKPILLFVLCLTFLFSSLIYLDLSLMMGIKTNVNWYFLGGQNNVVIVFLSILIFLFFKDININYNRIIIKLINFFAPATLGVYLIHDNNYVRGYLWSELFNTTKHFFSGSFFLWSIYAIIAVFLICSVIDRILALLERPLFKFISNKLSGLDNKMRELFT